MPSLQGKICVVTGAARGIGRGIALQLGEAGATVYITGRTEKNLADCVQEINNRGGKGISVVMDHGNDSDVEALFERVKQEHKGRLDILVNNAYAGVSLIDKSSGKKFYETDPVEQWDVINGVGLRNHYICATLASRIMVKQQHGLIINVSSFGGLRYLFNVAYGVGKAAVDRMAADCAVELKKQNVAFISLWPGPVKTEYIQENILNKNKNDGSPNSLQSASMFAKGETIECAGRAITYLANDPNLMKKTGRILQTCDLAREYGFTDIDGKVPLDTRSLGTALARAGYTGLAGYVPDCIRFPCWMIHFMSYKF